MTLDFEKLMEKFTKIESVVVTISKLVDVADDVVDKVPGGLLPKDIREAREVLDQVRAGLDIARQAIEGATNGTDGST